MTSYVGIYGCQNDLIIIDVPGANRAGKSPLKSI